MNKPNPRKNLNDYARYSSLAFQMMAIIGVGIFGGMKLDKYLALERPVFTVLFSVISVILAVYYAIKDFLKK